MAVLERWSCALGLGQLCRTISDSKIILLGWSKSIYVEEYHLFPYAFSYSNSWWQMQHWPQNSRGCRNSTFPKVCLLYMQRWLRRNRGLLTFPCKTVPDGDACDLLSIGSPASLIQCPWSAIRLMEIKLPTCIFSCRECNIWNILIQIQTFLTSETKKTKLKCFGIQFFRSCFKITHIHTHTPHFLNDLFASH